MLDLGSVGIRHYLEKRGKCSRSIHFGLTRHSGTKHWSADLFGGNHLFLHLQTAQNQRHNLGCQGQTASIQHKYWLFQNYYELASAQFHSLTSKHFFRTDLQRLVCSEYQRNCLESKCVFVANGPLQAVFGTEVHIKRPVLSRH